MKKLGNPQRDAETIGMKSTGIKSRVEFRKKSIAAKNDLEVFKAQFASVKAFLNECVSELLEMNNIHHDHFTEKIEDGVLILDHYIVVPDEEGVLNTLKSSFDILMRSKDFEVGKLIEVRFHAAEVN